MGKAKGKLLHHKSYRREAGMQGFGMLCVHPQEHGQQGISPSSLGVFGVKPVKRRCCLSDKPAMLATQSTHTLRIVNNCDERILGQRVQGQAQMSSFSVVIEATRRSVNLYSYSRRCSQEVRGS